jgi:hypothetical protein
VICLETPKAGSSQTNWCTVPSLVSPSEISFPMSKEPQKSHRMVGGNVVQYLLALLHQWGGCFGSLKSSQSRLLIRIGTNVFLLSIFHLNFIKTGQDSIYLGLEDCSIFS